MVLVRYLRINIVPRNTEVNKVIVRKIYKYLGGIHLVRTQGGGVEMAKMLRTYYMDAP